MAQHHNTVQPYYTVSLIPNKGQSQQACVLHVLSTELYEVWRGDQHQFSPYIFLIHSKDERVIQN